MIFAIVHVKDGGEEVRINMQAVSLFPPNPDGDKKGCTILFNLRNDAIEVKETMDEVFASMVKYS